MQSEPGRAIIFTKEVRHGLGSSLGAGNSDLMTSENLARHPLNIKSTILKIIWLSAGPEEWAH